VLTTLVETPYLETKRYGEVPAVDAVVTHDPDQGALTSLFPRVRTPVSGAPRSVRCGAVRCGVVDGRKRVQVPMPAAFTSLLKTCDPHRRHSGVPGLTPLLGGFGRR